MRIHIATAQTPFCPNPTEGLAEELRQAVTDAGHLAELVRLPFKGYPQASALGHLLALRLLAFDSGPDDALIALEYPTYLVPHPRKVLWLARCESPPDWRERLPDRDSGDEADQRRMTDAVATVRRQAERRAWSEARGVYSISATLSWRWRELSGLDAMPLYPPPRRVDCHDDPPEDFILVPLSPAYGGHRMELVVDALAQTRQPVVLRWFGDADGTGMRVALNQRAAALGLEGRCQWLDGETAPYARSRAVLAVPCVETNPEVALLAMQVGKPLITDRDSGAPAELVMHRRTGWVVKAKPAALARAMDEAWSRPDQTRALGEAARAYYESLGLDWAKVVERLLD